MIEINEHNGIWELYVAGALYDYSPDLQTLPEMVGRSAESIINFMNVKITD